jgi:hypothetical protein
MYSNNRPASKERLTEGANHSRSKTNIPPNSYTKTKRARLVKENDFTVSNNNKLN